MTRQLGAGTTLEELERDAQSWAAALGAGDAAARERLERAWPGAPDRPRWEELRDALAREHGHAHWCALRARLHEDARADVAHAERAAWFVRNACPDHHVRGAIAHHMARHAALRILRLCPDVARAGLHAAVVCGDVSAVERHLADDPAAADAPLGSKRWTPLLYLCFARLDTPAATANALAIARLLLDAGADPNAHFMAGGSRYTPLVGAIGEGEEHRPPHATRDALVRLLLERGAEPYDDQVLYNVHVRGDVGWLLPLLHERALALGRARDWDDPEWRMLDMGGYGSGARYLLNVALEHDDLALGEWLLAHGASPDAAPPPGGPFWRPPQHSLHETALRQGRTEFADLLLRHGATPTTPDAGTAFAEACGRGDHDAAAALAREHSDAVSSTRRPLLFTAARRDRADVVALLLDGRLSPDELAPGQSGHRPLHEAAYHGARAVAELLLARGATVDPADSKYDATPLWFALWNDQPQLVELLAPRSRDVWALTVAGEVARVRAVLAAEPRAATWGSESTPLMYLPDDEARALELAQLFLDGGADASRRDRDGATAADLARWRGLDAAAEVLRAAERQDARSPTVPVR